MDAGTAAVLGALAGSVATIGAALATGWAQREGARITARSEHRRERREPRHAVYKTFISKADRMRHRASVYSALDDGLSPDYVTEEQLQELFAARSEIKDKATEAALAGPKKVTEAALVVARLSHELAGAAGVFSELTEPNHQRMRDHQRKNLLRLAKEYEKSVDDFTLRAQSALDDDGSRN
ncbi:MULTISPECIES: hypothetical protein [unclassified Streptomyces]|uniref:hypothetical protein n=1 Tax=unclassified Streptomyces TaxID=2593676 RepID=UPI00115FD2B0|nr:MULTISPECIES: hypothetical protein [unclassified Streptomyces]